MDHPTRSTEQSTYPRPDSSDRSSKTTTTIGTPTTTNNSQDADKRTKGQLWFAAIKPPMYTVAITPILCGSFCFYADYQWIDYTTMLTFLLAAIFIIAWINLTNDVFDFDTGVDKNKKESIVNLCGATAKSRNTILLVSMASLGSGVYLLSRLCVDGDKTLLACMSVAIFMGYTYQCPPFRLSYLGLGEPIAFVAWIISTCSVYYTQLSSASLYLSTFKEADQSFQIQSQILRAQEIFFVTSLSTPNKIKYLFTELFLSSKHFLFSTALLVAMPTSMILFCSHFHQIEDDRSVGKLSPIVRLGVKRASKLLSFLVVIFDLLPFVLLRLNLMHGILTTLLCLTIPMSIDVASFIHRYHGVPSVVFSAKYKMVRLHFAHGMLMSLGLYALGKTYRPI